ncbi:MAG: diguanylate cyclase [Synechococcales bacterium]|nr:diguanylate cyclase [Synechococcales bacterium]
MLQRLHQQILNYLQKLNRKHRFAYKFSLAGVLIIPFTVQVVAIVGLVGYLSYRNGEKAVEDLTYQLMRSFNQRVSEQLRNELAPVWQANHINQSALRQGALKLDLEQPNPAIDAHLWQHMQLFPHLTWISLGAESGASRGIWRAQPGADLQIWAANRTNGYQGHSYAINSQGQRTKLLPVERPLYDVRTRPWYREAIAAKKPVWNSIYTSLTTDTMFIAASQPLYDAQGKFVGVSGTDISLSNIQAFLVENSISPSGQVFLMERSGRLIASSSQEPAFRMVKGKSPKQVHISESNTPLIRATAAGLNQQIPDWANLKQANQLRFHPDQQSHFLQIVPFEMEGGLSWFIVMVMPQEDVMGQIYSGNRTNILICAATLLAVTLFNAWLSRRLVRAIRVLRDASQQITQGNFSQQVKDFKVQELSVLARAFNQMSQELKHSQQQLEDYSRSLEQKVNDRTQALQEEVQQRRLTEAALQAANRELEKLVYLDGLTQIANRRRFDEWIQREWAVAKREQTPISLILCDVDYFKQYNDTYGHQLGDDCLCFVADAIAQSVRRPADLAARYGGEEFVVVLPNTRAEGAIQVVKSIQAYLDQVCIPHERSQVSSHVTLSFGITSLIPTEANRLDIFIETADRALYQAKQAGRNRYMLH